MKKYLLFALLSCGLFAVNNAGAQSFSTQNGDTVIGYYNGVGNTNLTLANYIKSNNSAPVYLKWHVVPAATNMNGWTSSGICDNYNCYPTTGAGSILLGNSKVSHPYYDTGYADFHVFADGTGATVGNDAVVTIVLNDTINNYSKTVTFIAKKTAPTGIGNVANDDAIRMYPNPAREAINVTFDAAMDVHSIAVYSLIGKAVSVFKTSGTGARIDLSDVPAGVYLLRMANSNGQIVATRKFNHL